MERLSVPVLRVVFMLAGSLRDWVSAAKTCRAFRLALRDDFSARRAFLQEFEGGDAYLRTVRDLPWARRLARRRAIERNMFQGDATVTWTLLPRSSRLHLHLSFLLRARNQLWFHDNTENKKRQFRVLDADSGTELFTWTACPETMDTGTVAFYRDADDNIKVSGLSRRGLSAPRDLFVADESAERGQWFSSPEEQNVDASRDDDYDGGPYLTNHTADTKRDLAWEPSGRSLWRISTGERLELSPRLDRELVQLVHVDARSGLALIGDFLVPTECTVFNVATWQPLHVLPFRVHGYRMGSRSHDFSCSELSRSLCAFVTAGRTGPDERRHYELWDVGAGTLIRSWKAGEVLPDDEPSWVSYSHRVIALIVSGRCEVDPTYPYDGHELMRDVELVLLHAHSGDVRRVPLPDVVDISAFFLDRDSVSVCAFVDLVGLTDSQSWIKVLMVVQTKRFGDYSLLRVRFGEADAAG